MKKLLVSLLAVALGFGFSMRTQAQDTKHELAVSYGVLGNTAWLDAIIDITTTIGTIGTCSYDNNSFVGPISMEYFYHVNPLVGVGAIGAYSHSNSDIVSGKEKRGTANNSFFTVMPAVKLDWFRRDMITLYSKFGLGVSIRNEKDKYIEGAVKEGEPLEYTYNKAFFNWQASLLGVEFGKSVRGFLEVGCGEQGIALAGLRFIF